MKEYNFKIESIYIEITNKCNFYCKTCYNNSLNSNNIFLTFDDFVHIVNEGIKLGCKIVYFSGGEPLLNKHIWDMIAYCSAKDITPVLVTNGSLLTEENIIKLIKFNVPIQISLDGYDKYTNDVIRGEETFDKVTKSLNLLRKYNHNSSTKIRCTLNKWNSKDLHKYIELAKMYSVHELSFGWMAPIGRGLDCFQEAGIYEDYYTLYKEVNNLKRSHESNSLIIGQMELINCCPMLEDMESYIKLNIRITPQQDVCLCQRISTCNEILGNTKTSRLSDIIYSDKTNELLKKLLDRKYLNINNCGKCFINSVCKRGCPGLAYQNGNVLGTDSFCESRKKLFIELLKNNRKKEYGSIF